MLPTLSQSRRAFRHRMKSCRAAPAKVDQAYALLGGQESAALRRSRAELPALFKRRDANSQCSRLSFEELSHIGSLAKLDAEFVACRHTAPYLTGGIQVQLVVDIWFTDPDPIMAAQEIKAPALRSRAVLSMCAATLAWGQPGHHCDVHINHRPLVLFVAFERAQARQSASCRGRRRSMSRGGDSLAPILGCGSRDSFRLAEDRSWPLARAGTACRGSTSAQSCVESRQVTS